MGDAIGDSGIPGIPQFCEKNLGPLGRLQHGKKYIIVKNMFSVKDSIPQGLRT